jgi:hypothetical protein
MLALREASQAVDGPSLRDPLEMCWSRPGQRGYVHLELTIEFVDEREHPPPQSSDNYGTRPCNLQKL